jgi:alkylated DNA repair dioxygenase AlkB
MHSLTAQRVSPGQQTTDVRTLIGDQLLHVIDFIAAPTAAEWFDCLNSTLHWTQPRVRMFGREIDSPRLAAWHGDPDAFYTYSGLRNEPAPWTPELDAIRASIEDFCEQKFNSVLVNLYRDGADSMGWHSDDERELAPDAAIASLSLGTTRRFRLRHRQRHDLRIEIPLSAGCLVIMRSPLQRSWQHCVMREKGAMGARINLTFRSIR